MKRDLTHYSRGLYSTWTYLKPFRMLIDVGEGLCSYMQNRLYAIETIYLTHDHMDHMAGLMSFFGLRRAAAGDKTKPLVIMSACDRTLERAREILKFTMQGRECPYEVTFRKIHLGERIELVKNKFLEPVDTFHTPGSTGVLIYNESKRLRKTWQENELFMRDIREGRRKVLSKHLETHQSPLFLNVLDNNGLNFEKNTFTPKSVKLMIEDLTFPRGHENDDKKHNDLQGVARNLKQVEPKHVLLSHVSSRHTSEDPYKLQAEVREELYALGVDRAITIDLFAPRRGLAQPYTIDLCL